MLMSASAQRGWIIVAGLSGFVSIAMGAAGAHLAGGAYSAALVEKAALYQLIHAAMRVYLGDKPQYRVTCGLFLLGTVLFCGALDLKAMTGWAWAARPAPFGGVSLMLGWLALVWQAARRKSMM